MKYSVLKSGAPGYVQLYNQIKEDIVSGAYPYGSKLPSKRMLSAETGVSVITVEHAYTLLSDEGYIESRERSGYFVIYKEGDFLSHGTANEYEPIRPSKSRENEETDFPFSSLAKKIRKVLLDNGDAILDKSHNKGLPSLRKSISSYLDRTVGIKADPSQIIIGAGAEYLYGLALLLLGKDRIYALEAPSYKTIERVYEANGVRTELLPLGKNGIRREALLSSSASVLHITPYNSYPSLVTADANKRREYLEFARQRQGYIIEDNYDSELTVSKKHEETLFSLTKDDNVIYINTFSKTISSAIRMGYMVLPRKLVENFDERLGFYSCTVSTFEQLVISEIIDSGEFERHINRVRRAKRKDKSGYIK